MIERRLAHGFPAPDLSPDEHWTERAACGPDTADLFIIPGKSRDWNLPHNREQRDEAAAICATCPVIETCLRDAIERDDWETFAGGKTPAQRGRWVSDLRRVPPEPTVPCPADCGRMFTTDRAASVHHAHRHGYLRRDVCRDGHAMTPDNTAATGRCRECSKVAAKARRDRLREAS